MSDAADLDASSDTNISISQSTKEESCSREDPEASTDPKTGTSQPTTEGQSCDDKNPDASSDTTTVPLKPLTENESSHVAEAPKDTSRRKRVVPFDDPTVRRAFVRKVFGIQIFILLFAVGVVCLFMFSDVIRNGLKRNLEVFISSVIIFLAVIIIICTISMCYSWRHPWNLLGLALVTLSLSFMLGTTASYIGPTFFLTVLGDTILTLLSIIAFNAQSRVDFNLCFGFILSLAVPLIKFWIMYGIYPDFSFILFVGLGSVCAFGLSMVFVIDIQMMTVWKRSRVRPEEYVTAALLMYQDILLAFLCIMGPLPSLPWIIICCACRKCFHSNED